MTTDAEIDTAVDALAEWLGLVIEPDYRAGVAFHLSAARAVAEPLLSLEFDDAAEPAPVFVA